MIINISDRKDTSFLSIDKALSNKIKFYAFCGLQKLYALNLYLF